jgi:hypothetical protein
VDEFHTLNRCLDDAFADAVTGYARLREQLAPTKKPSAWVLSHTNYAIPRYGDAVIRHSEARRRERPTALRSMRTGSCLQRR